MLLRGKRKRGSAEVEVVRGDVHGGRVGGGAACGDGGKKEALEAVGIRVGKTPAQAAQYMREALATLG